MRRLLVLWKLKGWNHFNPRTPRGVRLPADARRSSATSHFNPRTPRGVRLAANCSSSISRDTFQSTHPARGATRCAPSCAALWTNFNPRTPRGVRLSQAVTFTGGNLISIHAPREGCDAAQGLPFNGDRQDFNPRTPRGVRPVQSGSVGRSYVFQSTRAPRGPPSYPARRLFYLVFQSTHPARGATRATRLCRPLI